MTSGAPIATFRDPCGSLSLIGDQAVRTIHAGARQAALDFVASPFYKSVVERGDMVSTVVDDSADGLRLIHPRIAVPSYPWEWTASQWLAAAELTIDLCAEGLSEGWMLKDATPLNILFVGSRPVLVDVLSFERRDPGSSIWLAYGQYTRTFLLPLIMNRLLGWPLELALFKRDGFEPSEVYKALSWGQRLSRTALWPISLPAWLEKRKGPDAAAAKKPKRSDDAELTAHILGKTLADLKRRTRAALPQSAGSEWSEYQASLTHYTGAEVEEKRRWVSAVFERLKPQRVLDIGANTGEYSALASSWGAEAIALERDAAAADRLFQRSCAERLAVQTIHADFARPTPAVGWENGEYSSLLDRLEGRCDVVMMLAVIHHLILMEQIPVGAILDAVHRLTQRWLVLEWVPVADPMFQSLMRGRDELYGSLSESDLERACVGRFRCAERTPLTNGRILFLFEKIG